MNAIVAESSPMRLRLRLLQSHARRGRHVFLSGEQGVGKRTLARCYHAWSGRRAGPFLLLETAGKPVDVLERELFGYDHGLRPNAHEPRAGLLERADGGVLVIRNVAALPGRVQVRLLDCLRRKRTRRLGSETELPADVCIVACASRPLHIFTRTGRLLHGLARRFRMGEMHIPPLGERRRDVLPLALHFLQVEGRRLGRSGLALSSDARLALLRHRWPGNLEELRRAMRIAVKGTPGRCIDLAALRRVPELAVEPVDEEEGDVVERLLEELLRGELRVA